MDRRELFNNPPLNDTAFNGDATRQSWPTGVSIRTNESRSKGTFKVERMKSNIPWWRAVRRVGRVDVGSAQALDQLPLLGRMREC